MAMLRSPFPVEAAEEEEKAEEEASSEEAVRFLSTFAACHMKARFCHRYSSLDSRSHCVSINRSEITTLDGIVRASDTIR